MGNLPDGPAVTPDGKHVYVVNGFSNNISVIDTATNTVEAATLAVGSFPVGIAVTPDGKHAYVVNSGSNSVSVIDTATNTVEAATLAVGRPPARSPSPGRDTRLCREFRLQQRFGDRHRHQHGGGGDARGGG